MPVQTKKVIKKINQPFLVCKAPLDNCTAYEKKGHWTEKQKLKYVIFIEHFKQKFTSKDNKKRFCKVFKAMSDFIKTRTHNQCRSHHQKMEKERFQVDIIISNITSKYHPRVYKQNFQRYLSEFQNLNIDYDQKTKKKIKKKVINEEIKIQSLQKRKKIVQQLASKISIQQNCHNEFAIKEQYTFKNYPVKKYHNLLAKTQDQFDDEEPIQQEKQEKPFEYSLQDLKNPTANKSLDCLYVNTYSVFPPRFYANSIQQLQVQRLNSLSNATFHYNQYQIQMRNAIECQNAKISIQRNNKMKQSNHLGFQLYHGPVWQFKKFNSHN